MNVQVLWLVISDLLIRFHLWAPSPSWRWSTVPIVAGSKRNGRERTRKIKYITVLMLMSYFGGQESSKSSYSFIDGLLTRPDAHRRGR